MSLTQALSTAVSGMRVNQSGLSVIASNVANAETPGWVRKTADRVTIAGGGVGVGVRIGAINRELDQYIQRQLRVESSGAAYAGLRADFYGRLQSVYGVPGSTSALESSYNNLLSSLQTLSTSPESAASRSAVVNAAQVLAQQLNSMSNEVQSLRGDAELGLADVVNRANEAMQQIADLNRQLAAASPGAGSTAALMDQRDAYIDQLSRMMDIKVVNSDHNQVSVFTNSGIELVGLNAATLSFDAQGSMNASTQWSSDPAQRNVGTITLKAANGGDIDLLKSNAIRSGEIAAYVEMRDQVLVEAQTQLDEMAAAMARALSDRTTNGTAVTPGGQSGFDIDLSALANGNTVRVSYTDNVTGAQKTLTLARVDDPNALPLSRTSGNDQLIGIDFSGGMSSVLSQLSAALGSTGLQFSNPSGNTLRILDDGAANRVDIKGVSATTTATGLAGGTPELPFFVDGTTPYTGAISASGSQTVGFAGRIAVNAGLIADPSRMVVFQTSPLTPNGDATRPNFLYDRLNSGAQTYSPQSGIGAPSAPFSGSIHSFLRQVITQQGAAADAAANLKDGQDVVFNALQQRFDESATVNIDEEMANLLNLQNAYAANARVLTTVKEMIDMLLKM